MDHVIRRQHGESRLRVALLHQEHGQTRRGGGVAPHGLPHNIGGGQFGARLPATGQLGLRREHKDIFPGHNPGHPVDRLREHRLVPDDGQQMLGRCQPALGPEALAAAPGHDHNKTFGHASTI